MLKKAILLAGAMTLALNSAETSVFEAGNLENANPYGLTDSEKAVLKNRRNVQNVESNLSVLTEQVQGLSSIVEGLSARMQKIEQRLNELEARVNGDTDSTTLSLTSIKEYSEETRRLQEKNFDKINKALNKLGALIDKGGAKAQSASNQEASSADKFKGKNKADLLSQAKDMLSKDSKGAIERLEYLISQNYKPAMSNFYLGESYYFSKSYQSAIKYYQKSIELYDKADYIPKLLYHTAISFDKIGDTASANKFYKALKVGYPDSKEAQAAPSRE
ncbi:tol-pal system YbgF family protein [Campylobacter sp. 19-13652]|uniref:tetratricopeptide repeat protein n=1 Tax=Campylobacter sp. 19-13652 TaxID=2840180 RepID=UPI001C78D079|nr:tetratricopeptide repeat protein [Campylobacter sp. 19-13652]BCX78954.1 hypothetical protein LBC_04160 [Campylobacter sp. 19-13652]